MRTLCSTTHAYSFRLLAFITFTENILFTLWRCEYSRIFFSLSHSNRTTNAVVVGFEIELVNNGCVISDWISISFTLALAFHPTNMDIWQMLKLIIVYRARTILFIPRKVPIFRCHNKIWSVDSTPNSHPCDVFDFFLSTLRMRNKSKMAMAAKNNITQQ